MKKYLSLVLLGLLLFATGCKNTVDTIIITIDAKDGSNPTEVIIEVGEAIEPLEDLVRDGYDFGGWFFDINYTEDYFNDYLFFEDANIYAKWIPHVYSIDFISDGGTAVPLIKVNHNETLKAPVTPTKNNYKFTGWYTDKTLTKLYDFTKPVTESFWLFAGWERVYLPLIEQEEYEVKYIVTSPGEDASTMININYQNKTKKSSIEYTTADDGNYLNKKIINPTGFGFEEISSKLEKPFPMRNINKATIKDLTPNTSYKYRINMGNDTYTEDYYFTTSGGEDTTSFLFVSDVHYYDGYDGAEIVEQTIESAKAIQPGLDFILSTGDMVDTGGNAEDWDKLFTHSESFKTLPFLGVPGNHEHYIIDDTRNDIMHAYFNFPRNSIEDYFGTTYYYIHNDTLFMQIDTDFPYRREELYNWVDQVITNNPTKFVIVGTHAPFNMDNTDYKQRLVEIMEKHSVDLVLSGHYHSHSIKNQYLGENVGLTNEQLGVTYLNGWGGGIKSVGTNLPEEFARGYIIDVLDKEIKIRYINARGDILGTYSVPNKKMAPVVPEDKQVLIDSITGDVDLVNEKITFTWDSKFFGNVKELKITETYREQRSITMKIPAPGYTKYVFDNILDSYDYEFIFDIKFSDGTTAEKKLKFQNHGGINLVATPEATTATITFDPPKVENEGFIQEYEVYLNGVLYKKYNAKVDGEFITSILIDNLNSKTNYRVEVRAMGRVGFMYREEISMLTK